MKQFIKENILESISHCEKKVKQGKAIDLCLKALREEIEDILKMYKIN